MEREIRGDIMEQQSDNLCAKPLKLLDNRVWRTYRGGRLLEQWQRKETSQDSDKPEEWVASIVEARNKNYIEGEGLSKVIIDENTYFTLKDLISADAKGFLGMNHVERFDSNMAVLTKVLDAAMRLSIQVHPTKAYAKQFFNSNYGKTEAWYIMGGRDVNGEPPHVYLGFKEGITRYKWKELFEKQDIEGMMNSLHKFYVKQGDVFLIEGGIPHAIGSGCFLIEVQEPTDYTMRVEKVAFDGSILPDNLCHQGVGFDNMLDCFNYTGFSSEETLKRWFKKPRILRKSESGTEIGLINNEDTDCFTMKKFQVNSELSVKETGFRINIVLGGRGEMLYGKEVIKIEQGDRYFIPAGVTEIRYRNIGDTTLVVISCYPPSSNFTSL